MFGYTLVCLFCVFVFYSPYTFFPTYKTFSIT